MAPSRTARLRTTLLLLLWLSWTSASAQSFTVVPAYEAVADYLQALRAQPETSPVDLYLEHVIEPLADRCELRPIGDKFERDPAYLAALETALVALEASDIEARVEAALAHAARTLPGPAVTLCLTVLDPDGVVGRQQMQGVTGSASPRGIILELYPEPGWLEMVPYVVAHEYHHLVLFDRDVVERPLTLLEVLLIEGRADLFASGLYPDLTPAWTRVLTLEQEARQWQRMQPQLDTTARSTLRGFMFGNGSTPRWTGYTIGLRIMESLLVYRPDLEVEGWTVMTAREILSESRYPDALAYRRAAPH